MPASMISAPTGGNPNVIGNSIATVATVPMPGKAPHSRPNRGPNKKKKIFNGAGTANPAEPRRQGEVDELEYDGEAETEIMKKLKHYGLTAPGNAGTAASAVPAHRGTGTRIRSSGRRRR